MKIFLVDLESVETRYTSQWKSHVPELLKKEGYDVQVISGPEDVPKATTPGAFLNFGGTNIYKSRQIEEISRLFCAGSISPGDHFIFTDAWHPGIINLKYMSELLNIPVVTHGLWHAGSYDPQDFLGRIIGDAPWVKYAEKSFFQCFNHNYFATEFHVQLFFDELLNNGLANENPWYTEEWDQRYESKKIVRSGWPMEYMDKTLSEYKGLKKRNLILFPHRLAPEKQVEIFRDLATQLPHYEFIVCQDQQLTKSEYHTLLGEAKMVFSANLQETLGISWYEGCIVDAMPMVPDRLSYHEMALQEFKYPSTWTENFESYKAFRPWLCKIISEHMEKYESRVPLIRKQLEALDEHYFSATKLLDTIREYRIN